VADVRVTCITKPHPSSPHEHITHLGNPQAGWKWSREDVIRSIEVGTNTFFVIDPYTEAFRCRSRSPGRSRAVPAHAC